MATTAKVDWVNLWLDSNMIDGGKAYAPTPFPALPELFADQIEEQINPALDPYFQDIPFNNAMQEQDPALAELMGPDTNGDLDSFDPMFECLLPAFSTIDAPNSDQNIPPLGSPAPSEESWSQKTSSSESESRPSRRNSVQGKAKNHRTGRPKIYEGSPQDRNRQAVKKNRQKQKEEALADILESFQRLRESYNPGQGISWHNVERILKPLYVRNAEGQIFANTIIERQKAISKLKYRNPCNSRGARK
ncbi:unnamed protein product, partial [Mesorhabditis spiculigera]